MKAAAYDAAGSPDVLHYRDVPDPACPDDGVVIRVRAAAIEGGVGIAAIQLAKLAGARVIGTVSGVDRAERLTRLGLAAAIDPRTEDVADAV